MLTVRTASAEDVAGALGITVAALKRKTRALHAKKGFPLPLPGAAWRWSSRAVADWIDAAGMAAPIAEPATDRTNLVGLSDELVHRQRAALHERYGSRS